MEVAQRWVGAEIGTRNRTGQGGCPSPAPYTRSSPLRDFRKPQAGGRPSGGPLAPGCRLAAAGLLTCGPLPWCPSLRLALCCSGTLPQKDAVKRTRKLALK